MSELAADGIPVTVACRVLKIARQPYYRWRKNPITDAELAEAYRANALFDAHREDPEFGYRYLADEAEAAGEKMCRRTAWRICSAGGWTSTISKRRPRQAPQGRPACTRRSRQERLHRARPQRAVADRHHRALDGRGQAVPVRDQGRLLGPDRRVLDRLENEVPPGRGRPEQRCRQARGRGRLRSAQR